MPGFKERFEHELKTYALNTAKTDINVYADLHRKFAAWIGNCFIIIGGSMIASFNTFSDLTIKRQDYEESSMDAKGGVVLKRTIF
jgi:actin-related protein